MPQRGSLLIPSQTAVHPPVWPPRVMCKQLEPVLLLRTAFFQHHAKNICSIWVLSGQNYPRLRGHWLLLNLRPGTYTADCDRGSACLRSCHIGSKQRRVHPRSCTEACVLSPVMRMATVETTSEFDVLAGQAAAEEPEKGSSERLPAS